MAAEDIGDLLVRIEADIKDFQKKMDQAIHIMDETQRKSTGLAKGIKDAFSFAGGFAIFEGIKKGFEGSVKAGFDFDRTMQQNKIALESMLGSAEKADTTLNKLADMAAKTPFTFPQLTDATKKMLAFGFEVGKIPDMLTAVGDAAAGLSLGQDGINRITIALGQLQAKGRVQAQEMLQLTEAGIPAWDLLAKGMNKSTAEVMKLSEKGLIPASKAIDILVDGMEEKFPNMMDKQSKSFDGLMSTMKDNVQMTFGEVVKPLFDDLTNNILPDMISGMDDFRQRSGEQGLGAAINTLVLSFDKWIPLLTGGATALLAYKSISGISAAIDMWRKSTFAMTLAQQGLNAAIMTNPIAVYAAAVGGLVAVISGLVIAHKKAIDDMKQQLIDGYREERDEAIEIVNQRHDAKINSLNSELDAESSAHEDRLGNIQEEYNKAVSAIGKREKELKRSLQERQNALEDAHDEAIRLIQEEYGVFEETQKSKTDLIQEATKTALDGKDDELKKESERHENSLSNIRSEYGEFEQKHLSKIDKINNEYSTQKGLIAEILGLAKDAATQEGDSYSETYNAIIEKAREVHNEKIAMYQEEYLNSIGLINSELKAKVDGFKEEIKKLEDKTREENKAEKDKRNKETILRLQAAVANAKDNAEREKANKDLNDEINRQNLEAEQENRRIKIESLNAQIKEAVDTANDEKESVLKILQDRVNEEIPILEQRKNDEIKIVQEERKAKEDEEKLKFAATKKRIDDEKAEIEGKAAVEIAKVQEERKAKEEEENKKYEAAKSTLDREEAALDDFKENYKTKLEAELKLKQDTEDKKFKAVQDRIKNELDAEQKAINDAVKIINEAFDEQVKNAEQVAKDTLSIKTFDDINQGAITAELPGTKKPDTNYGQPIEGYTVNPGGTSITIVPKRAIGDQYWQGGPVAVNEDSRGEVINLPRGSQIIPHDVSMNMTDTYGKEIARLSAMVGNGFDASLRAVSAAPKTPRIASSSSGTTPNIGRQIAEALSSVQSANPRMEITVISQIDGREVARATAPYQYNDNITRSRAKGAVT